KVVAVVSEQEYDVEYGRLPAGRAWSNSISTKIVEIENAGTPKERALPEGNDHGYMWRLNSYWGYKQVDDGGLVCGGGGVVAAPEPGTAGDHGAVVPADRERHGARIHDADAGIGARALH